MTRGDRDAQLRTLITGARWFGGKGREFRIAGVSRLGRIGDAGVLDLVELKFSDSADAEFYQLPLAFYAARQEALAAALIGTWDDADFGISFVYDATHDQAVMGALLARFAVEEPSDNLEFRRLPGHDLDLTAKSQLFTGEQSNSSIAFGQDALLKVFRKVTPGLNPDVEIHSQLTQSGSTHIAALYGWLEYRSAGGNLQLAMLQQFLPAAKDGFDLAQESVRDSAVGFEQDAAQLGVALAEIHGALAAQFPTVTYGTEEMAGIKTSMGARLDAARQFAPTLTPYAARLRTAYDALGALSGVSIQRIHGDLHLGQTLRTAEGWKIVDFEGEPAKTLKERQLPDSPWRDVAGMLRSFDYAAHAALGPGTISGADWVARNQQSFLSAYAGRKLTSCEEALLAAYVADKAVYETVYETRNRPSWVSIPLQALAKIGAA